MTEPLNDLDGALEGNDRRAFLKKLAIGTAFVPPAVSSFTMSGISAVYAQTPSVSGQVDSDVDSDEVEATTTTEPTTTTTAPNQTDTTTTTTTAPNQTDTTTTTLVSNQPPPE